VASLFASGRIVDCILGVMALEWCFLSVATRVSMRGLRSGEIIASLSAGAALLLALRGSLTGSRWEVTAAWLGLAGLAHLIDLRMRFAGNLRVGSLHAPQRAKVSVLRR
jgi:hypothetical protein